jgi:hypothetical protein
LFSRPVLEREEEQSQETEPDGYLGKKRLGLSRGAVSHMLENIIKGLSNCLLAIDDS